MNSMFDQGVLHLQETNGRPSLNEQEELQAAADKVMDLVVQLR